MDLAQNKISGGVLQQRVAAYFLRHVLSIFGPFCQNTCTFFTLFTTHISSQVMRKTYGTFLNMQWFYDVSRFNNLNWKGGNSLVILEWISQYFMYLVNEALRYWKFLWPTSGLKIGMLQVSAATNMTLNTMFWSFMSHQTYWLFRDKPTELIEGSRKVKSTHAMFIRRHLNRKLESGVLTTFFSERFWNGLHCRIVLIFFIILDFQMKSGLNFIT